MTLRQYTITLGVAAGTAWTGWLLVLWNVNPFEVGAPAAAIFLISLFLALLTTAALIGLRVRLFLRQETVLSRAAADAFREALLASSALIFLLILGRIGRITFITTTLVLLITIMGELWLIRRRRARASYPLPSRRELW